MLGLACSPMVQFNGVVEVAGVAQPDPSKLHVSLSQYPEQPPADPAAGDEVTKAAIQSEDGVLSWYAGFGGSTVTLAAHFWYDADGDGLREPGEPEAQFSGLQGRDRGIFSGNQNELPPILLSPTPKPEAEPPN